MKNIPDLLLSMEEQGVHIFEENGQLKYRTTNGQPIAPGQQQMLKEHKEAIITFLKKQDTALAGSMAQSQLIARHSNGPVPLSFSQERLWFIDQLQGSTNYHITSILHIEGMLIVDALEEAFIRLIRRHNVLRTIFNSVDGEPFRRYKARSTGICPILISPAGPGADQIYCNRRLTGLSIWQRII
jgi:hypothetical protein